MNSINCETYGFTCSQCKTKWEVGIDLQDTPKVSQISISVICPQCKTRGEFTVDYKDVQDDYQNYSH